MLLLAPSLARRRPQASPRLKPFPTFGTSSNHGGYWRLHPSGHLESQCRVNQGGPHRNLQGWYCLHCQHQLVRFQLAQLGVHRPGQQALHFYCLLLSVRHSKPLPRRVDFTGAPSPRVEFSPQLQLPIPPPSLPAREPISHRTHARAPAPTPLVLFTTREAPPQACNIPYAHCQNHSVPC